MLISSVGSLRSLNFLQLCFSIHGWLMCLKSHCIVFQAGIVNEKFLSSMKKVCSPFHLCYSEMTCFLLASNSGVLKGGLLVNIARGGLLDYKAVYDYLGSGHLGGLGIDVAWTEPFDPDDDILKFGNVIITPHVAGVTEHSYKTMAKVCV